MQCTPLWAVIHGTKVFCLPICKHFCFVVMQVIWTACLRWKDLQLTWWCFYWMPTKTWLHPLSREMRKEWAAVSIFSWCGHLVCSYEITVLGTIRYAWLNYHHHVACPSMSITFLTSWYLLDSNSGGHPFPILPFLPLHFPSSPSLQSFSFLPFASYLRQSSNRVWRIYMPDCATLSSWSSVGFIPLAKLSLFTSIHRRVQIL